MDNNLIKLVQDLESAVFCENFIDIASEIIEEISESKNAFDAVQCILLIMEKNPKADFGKPGPLVHFVEKFYGKGYEEKLVESIKRYPTKHTVWMLNRVINDSKDDNRAHFVKILNQILTFPNIDKDILELVNHFSK